jgi:endoglucanase
MTLRRLLLALGVTALTGAALVAAPSAAGADNLGSIVANRDFETGTDGWNAYPVATTVGGGGCIAVPAGTGAYGAGFAQAVHLEPDTTYVLRFTAYLGSGTPGPIRAVVQLPRDPYTQYLPEQAIAASLTDGRRAFTFEFTTPADLPPAAEGGGPHDPNAELAVQQNGSNADAYQLCLDDVSLSKAGAEQVTNGSFDDGLTGWTSMYPNPSIIDGYGCVDVPAGTGAYGAGIGQLVALEPDTDYVLRFTARLLEGSGTPGPIRAVVQLPRDPYTQYLPEQALAAQLSTEDSRFEFRFSTPSELPPATEGGDPAGPNAELTIQQNGPTSEAYVLCADDVSLVGGAAPAPYEPDTGPRVRVNHVGYLTNGPKHATLVSSSTDPIPWELQAASGTVVASGTSTPVGFDESARLDVHTIDFSDVTTAGSGYTLTADGATSFSFDIGIGDVYDQLRYDALNYYYPARSGIEIDGAIAGAAYARPAGHVSQAGGADTNQGDFGVGCQSIDNQTDDAGNFYYGSEWACPTGYALDVVGGWYDAGDHGKYVVNGGISVAQLMSTYERALTAPTGDPEALGDGTLNIPETGNGVPDVLDEARWELEWMLSMQVPAGSEPQLIDDQLVDVSGMAHHKIHDEGWTGLPLLPHDDPRVRSLHRPSTAATLNLAAVAAQGARLFAPYDATFAAELLASAETAYRAAAANPAIHAPAADGAEGGGPYSDDDVSDELYWATAELYLTTGDGAYRDAVLASPLHEAYVFRDGGFSWGEVAALARLDLATVPNDLPDRAAVRQSVVNAAERYLTIQERQPFDQPYAGESGVYVWGSNSQVANNLVVLGTAFDLTGDAEFRQGVARGIDYLLGRNPLNWSYVTGYGEDGYNSVNQHSRWWAAQIDPSLPHPPPGTLAGGPNSQSETWDPVAQSLFSAEGCAPQQCYIDDIGSWSTNELTINWNAPTAWVASFLADQDEGEVISLGACSVRYHVNGTWPGGYNAQVWITNTGSSTIDGWQLDWAFPGDQEINDGWSGTFTQSGATVSVDNLSWNAALDPGQTLTCGFVGSAGTLTTASPETFRLNGTTCVTE